VNDWFQAIVLGIVQGLTEFLPVSSTAHILVISKILGWEDPGAAFTAVTQIGTEFAVLIYFRTEIAHILRTLARWFYNPKIRGTADSRLAWAVVWGSMPIAFFGLLFKSFIENEARNLWIVGTTLIVFGFILILVERYETSARRTTELSIRNGLIMGFAQALALIPGVSRSGATISAGILFGLERRAATRYAFLLAIPAVLGSGALEALSISEGPVAWGPTIVATITASVIGFGVIAGLLTYLQRHTFTAFGVYRIALGSMILASVGLGLLSAY
jgi:undecaprenyl-diphosphatase